MQSARAQGPRLLGLKRLLLLLNCALAHILASHVVCRCRLAALLVFRAHRSAAGGRVIRGAASGVATSRRTACVRATCISGEGE